MHFRSFHTNIPNFKTVPKNLKGKSTSSVEWLTRHLNDPYVKKAQEMNFRARSAFKLIEMDDKIKILKPGQIVVDCGAAPGAMTQVIIQRINSDAKAKNPKKPVGVVIGIDLLGISPLPGAILLPQTDFTCPSTPLRILELLKSSSSSPKTKEGDDKFIDIVLSDMAPNATGTSSTDHHRIIGLARKALLLGLDHGKKGSHFLAKIWDGNETQEFIQQLQNHYEKVIRLKPKSSRSDSSELFLFASAKKIS